MARRFLGGFGLLEILILLALMTVVAGIGVGIWLLVRHTRSGPTVCGRCGAQVRGGAAFCWQCGTRLR